MTNYEWLVKNKAEMVKDILTHQLGKIEGKPKNCFDIGCGECEFFDYSGLIPCINNAKEWLDEEHEPLYKKGDIVIDSYSQLAIIKEDDCGEDYIMVSHYTDNTTGMKVLISGIKKKVGHIDESEE